MAVESAYSNRLLSLKFICDTLSVSALINLVTLTFNFLTLNLVDLLLVGVGNLPTNFGVSGTLRSRHMGQQLPEGPPDPATLTFDFGGHRICRDTGLRSLSVYQVRSS